MDHRGGPTQEVERAEDAQGDGENGRLAQEGGAPPWPLSPSSRMMGDNARK